MGTRKIYEKIQPVLKEKEVKIGRDGLFDIMFKNNLLVKNKKRKIRTTQSHHWLRKYPNKIRDFVPTIPNQLWVSDITYFKVNKIDTYISLITDAYSHKIIGENIAKTLEAVESEKALKKAISKTKNIKTSHISLIHHSDRGVQYCSKNYVKLLTKNNISISMTENGDPLENAIAERINGIIKQEYLENLEIESFEQAKKCLKKAVKLYNEDRPHMSIGNQYPSVVHKKCMPTKKLWKNYYDKSKRNNDSE